ncbi:hypothetical protein PENTCL1PPCAC_13026, partial [Pristionchus entomophagus]
CSVAPGEKSAPEISFPLVTQPRLLGCRKSSQIHSSHSESSSVSPLSPHPISISILLFLILLLLVAVFRLPLLHRRPCSRHHGLQLLQANDASASGSISLLSLSLDRLLFLPSPIDPSDGMSDGRLILL